MNCIICEAQAPFWIELHRSRYHQCPECSLIFLDPSQRLSLEGEKAKYDFHQNDPSDQGYRKFLQPVVDQVVQRVSAGMKGLDFGCGPGPTVSVMLGEREIACSDYDPIYKPNEDLLDQTYDFITCTEVIEHCFDPIEECKKLQSMMGPGGFIVMMTLFFDDASTFEQSHYHRDPTHIAFYSQKTFMWIAKELGMHADFPCTNIVVFS